MTNDTESPSTTPVDPATFDVHPLYHLVGLAEMVSQAEQALQESARRIRERSESIERDLDRGSRLNSLGELQSTAAAVDRDVARLEAAAEAFRSGRIYLDQVVAQARQVTDPAVQYAPAIIDMVEWFDRTVAASPRASKIWSNPA